MQKEFERYIADNNMLDKNSLVLMAISGGIDSMVMAYLFKSAGIRSGIAHCNFSLRGKESDLDEDLVRRFADENNIPFFSTRFKTKDYASANGLSVQMAARELRYQWFEETRLRNGYDLIAVAHNLNDNIETLLINLTRGTGISGLTGIRPVSNSIIRPLLFATRSEIEICSKKHNIPFREDRSNADTKYTRNKIRHLVIPVLKEINPAIERTLSETIGRLSGTGELVERYISNLRDSISITKKNICSFDLNKLNSYLTDKTVLFELFRPYGLSGSQLNDLSDVIHGKTGGQLFTVSHRIIKNRNKIIISPNEQISEYSCHINKAKELKNVPGIESVKFKKLTGNFVIPDDKLIACLDAEETGFPVIVRRWEKGDFFYPLGMRHKKKLSDFLTDKKLSLLEKEKILVLESGGRIAWVIGERIDARFRIKPSTTRAIIIKSAGR
ncbi:MAG: tRNA lysidine(34) synthetase TilS [Bacteroidetes bacterium GWE2_41_25]|nr:MAG: tRNA lysidine(34) synthetase TilS [Bacteroidetes bacterium GWC2_40_22]OFY00462.1 MAG: tRNA lysidine(34) synthetase TilS [Bacteroidetes bacterium GWE2_41_25]OFY60914.1 MAG: tRNA lysidine(34) synthetase TilS [Bacteroidetes bacterium GWF2_41_9]HAM10002.1 tRNA lysidine(34) synthetase TilS [Bacteroidales bacterium]HBH84273.1 tRNA lysidine(34) synthetase TilS [Bacteroidales bacterium]